MKLIMCDVCRKVQKPSEMSSIKLCLSDEEYVYKNHDDYKSYCLGEEIIKDVCFDCTVDILKLLYPGREILTREEIDQLKGKA